ncbi:MAG TPA: amidase, partial [Methylovirgula sp.]
MAAPWINSLQPFSKLAEKFKAGQDTPRHFLERCIAEIEQKDRALRAFVHLDIDRARRAADDSSVRYRMQRTLSCLDGLPVGIKDIIETRDQPTQMNSPIFAGFQPRRDAACVLALKKAGAIILGKTATAEFACGRSPETRNPSDYTRTPGGSSSGSAAAIGAGLIPAALGTQTQGSTIRPASYCGVYGLKPSHSHLSLDGVAPLSPTLDHLGLLGSSLTDIWNMVTVIAKVAPGPHNSRTSDFLPPQPAAPRRLIRLDTKGWAETDEASKHAFESAVVALKRAGVEVIDRKTETRVDALERDLLAADEAATKIYSYEAQWPLRAYAACGEAAVGTRILQLIEIADQMPRADYERAIAAREKLRATLQTFAGKI